MNAAPVLGDPPLRKSYAAGELIVASTPYAYVLSARENGRYCDSCFSPKDNVDKKTVYEAHSDSTGTSLKRCSACKHEWYCSRACQQSAWLVHRHECKLLAACAPKVPADSVRLLLHVCMRYADESRRRQSLPGADSTADPGWRAFSDLMSHEDKMTADPKRLEQFTEVIQTLRVYCKPKLHDFELLPASVMLTCFGRICTNSFSICNSEMKAIGVGLYLSPSVFDHSCVPNAVATFTGVRMNVRALRYIDTSTEEVFISYTDLLTPTRQRQENLWQQYYFHCKCPRCTSCPPYCVDEALTSLFCGHSSGDDPDHDCDVCNRCDLASVQKRAAAILALHDKASNTDDFATVATKANSFLSDTQSPLGKGHELVVRVRDALLNAYLETGKWRDAIETAAQLVESYLLCSELPHAPTGVLYFILAKLLRHLYRLDEASVHFHKALAILGVTHGHDHALVKDLADQQTQCECELTLSRYNSSPVSARCGQPGNAIELFE